MAKSAELKAARKKLQIVRIETPLTYYTGIDVSAEKLKSKDDLELLVISAMKKLFEYAQDQKAQGLADFTGFTLHFGITDKRSIFVFFAATYRPADGPFPRVTGSAREVIEELWNLHVVQ